MVIPDEAIKFILWQRTAFSEMNLDAEGVKASYAEEMEREYLSLREHLPRTCDSVLDIGCGCAGIDVFINRHYADHGVYFYLLDRTQIEEVIFYGFNPTAAFYNSLDVAETILTQNGVLKERIHLEPIRKLTAIE